MGFLSNLFRNKQEHQQHGRSLLEANRAFLKSAEKNKNILGQYQQRQAERAAQLAKRKAEINSKKSSPSKTASGAAISKTATTSHNSLAQVIAMLAKAPTLPTTQPVTTAVNKSTAAVATSKSHAADSKKRKSPATSQETSATRTKVAKTNAYTSANLYSSKTKTSQSGVSVSDIQKKGWTVATQGLTVDQKGALLPKLDTAVKQQKLAEDTHKKFAAQFPAIPTHKI